MLGRVWIGGDGNVYDPQIISGVDPFFEDNFFVIPISVYAPGSSNFLTPTLTSEIADFLIAAVDAAGDLLTFG